MQAPAIAVSTDTIFVNLSTHPSSFADTLTITNNGNATLVIGSIASTNSAITTGKADSVAAGKSLQCIVSFNPAKLAAGTAFLVIKTNDPVHPTDSVVIIIQGKTAVQETPARDSYSLPQNFPNPFSGITTIEYSLPQESRVTLKVFNALGNEIATLVNGMLGAGKHNTSFDATGLQNGIYFYRLAAGSSMQTGTMCVMR